MITECTEQGRAALLIEACRGPGVEDSEALAKYAAVLVKAGADAIVIRYVHCWQSNSQS